ncbi:MAG: RNase H family protein [Pyrinomonadaceae bacterium]
MKIRNKEINQSSSRLSFHPSAFILHPSVAVMIYCDGSSLGNGREYTRAAAVAILSYKDKWRAVGSYLGRATNQQAEIVAASVGLEALLKACHVVIFTDSRYVVETMEGRFRRKSNHEWWERLDRARSIHQVQWQWTKGHRRADNSGGLR